LKDYPVYSEKPGGNGTVGKGEKKERGNLVVYKGRPLVERFENQAQKRSKEGGGRSRSSVVRERHHPCGIRREKYLEGEAGRFDLPLYGGARVQCRRFRPIGRHEVIWWGGSRSLNVRPRLKCLVGSVRGGGACD